MRLTSNSSDTQSSSSSSMTRAPSASPLPSTVLQQLSRSNTFQTLIQSLSSTAANRSEGGFDELLNTRILHGSTNGRQQTSRGGSPALHRRNSVRDHRLMKRKLRSPLGTLSDFPLTFDIVECDGGRFSSSYGVENILRNDNTVYCSSKPNNVNILLKFNDTSSQNALDSAFTLTKLIVKAPKQGFTAPCKEGLIFVSHESISIEDTSKYDDFTEEQFKALMAGDNGRIDDSWPAAYFSVESESAMVTQSIVPNRSGKYILVKLLRANGELDNIDLQYLGLVGFTGPRSFAYGALR